MTIVRLGGSIIADEFESEPDPAARFRADAVSAEEAAEELADQQRLTVIEAIEKAEPPADLNVKVSDLPPARVKLATIIAWIASLEKERGDLQRGRAALMDRLGVPAMTEAAIAELETGDKTGLLQWVKDGARSVLPSLAREREREQLREKLAVDSYEADVARATLAAAEAQIDVLDVQLKVLATRRENAAKKCLIEHAKSHGDRYIAAISALQDTLAPLLGLAAIAGATRPDGINVGDEGFHTFYSDAPTYKQRLPGFGLSRNWRGDTVIDVDSARIAREVEPWKKLLAAWIADPRAKPTI